MSGPPAIEPAQTPRLSPANREGLRRNTYELRAHDGLLICMVGRQKAERGITEGYLELRMGPHGAFLRPVCFRDGPERSPNPVSARTWLGPKVPEAGRISTYRYNRAVCDRWTTVPRVIESDTAIDPLKS
jgi:hypothetical protein